MSRQLADFEGTWRIMRQITHADAPDAQYEGTAHWTPDEAGLLYQENGILTVTGHPPMQTERRYLWRAPLDVYFEDGRFFHTVPPGGGETRHWCAPDDYRVTYRFAAWPRFETVWRVQGPAKDYTMVSRYAPA
ncbi:trigger factor [Aliishimia ponticola]|uniref:Trigger factor n=1 Tax=Aliishimia ponticola TaxID=2499833 RepID=A0A4V3XKU1_9RHOB|nr:DUF6314 family protein [Aliishimia ponticola]THH38273.1 trigger factor [Aliishimia ponticola]